MDCKTARLLLDYARPGSRELDPTEAGALEEHLSACEGCDQLARAERRADEAVGKAMRQVDVPDRLRNRILARLKEERGDVRRLRVGYGLCAGVAAAAALLIALGVWRWASPKPAFPADQMLVDAQNRIIAPPSADEVKAAFAARGVEAMPPANLNYSYLRWMFVANVEGRPTPLLVFNNAGDDGGRPQHALVFLVSDDRFNLDALSNQPQLKSGAYEYKCATAVLNNGDKRSGYVVYHTGEKPEWLMSKLAPPETANGN